MMQVVDSRQEAERMLAQHAALERRVEALTAEATGAFDWRVLEADLEAMSRALAVHFELEETGGYLSEVRAQAPQEGRRIDVLEREHADLWKELMALQRRVEARGHRDEVRRHLAAWLERLRRHERAENELAQRAFTMDLGAKD